MAKIKIFQGEQLWFNISLTDKDSGAPAAGYSDCSQIICVLIPRLKSHRRFSFYKSADPALGEFNLLHPPLEDDISFRLLITKEISSQMPTGLWDIEITRVLDFAEQIIDKTLHEFCEVKPSNIIQ